MITTLRKNWLEIIWVFLCAASVFAQTITKKDYLYPIYFAGCFVVSWFSFQRLSSGDARVEPQVLRRMMTVPSLIFALWASNLFTKGNDPVGGFFFLAALFCISLTQSRKKPRATDWAFLYYLIAAVIVFVICFFTLMLYQSSTGKS